ncbi:autoinducer 2 ABC transporter substrate-binding protein [Mycoplasmatota bacterium zrk1]
MKKLLALLLTFVMALTLVGCSDSDDNYVMANVPKLVGINWFDRMGEGVVEYGEKSGYDTFQTGPTKADPALQVSSIEDVIAQGVDVLTVVPFSPEALEPVLKRAREEGIVVISHEASNQQNIDYDVEAFDNVAFGAHMMDNLAEATGGKGKYVIFVGGLTAKTHMEWAEGAQTRQEEAYPEMELVVERIESLEDSQVAYQKMKEVIQTYPDISGALGCAATDVAGVALAVEEAGLEDQVSIAGISLVSISEEYVERGTIHKISFWDPKDAALAMFAVAEKVLAGEEVKSGDDLGVPGYENVTVVGKVIYGNAWVDVDVSNMADYDF